jgi:hypothetical protein
MGSKKFPEFDTEGSVHHEFVPPGHSVPGHFPACKFCRVCTMQFRGSAQRWQGQCFVHHDEALLNTFSLNLI